MRRTFGDWSIWYIQVIRHPSLHSACGRLLNHQILSVCLSFLHKLIFISLYFSNFYICIKAILTHKSKITEGLIMKNCPCPTHSHPHSTFQKNIFNSYDCSFLQLSSYLEILWLIAIFWPICFRYYWLSFKIYEDVAL